MLSDILGESGRAVLQALIDGQTDPERLASCVTTRVKASRSKLLEALRGHVNAHHRFMLDAEELEAPSIGDALPFRREVAGLKD